MNIRSFEAIHYRGIDGLSLQNMSRANLITGVNGVGKTALIEAIWLFTGRHNIPLLWNTNVQRSRYPVIDPVAELSDGFIELRGKEKTKEYKWKVEFEPIEQVGEVLVGTGNAKETIQIPVVGQLHTWINGKKIDSKGRSAIHQTVAAQSCTSLHHGRQGSEIASSKAQIGNSGLQMSICNVTPIWLDQGTSKR